MVEPCFAERMLINHSHYFSNGRLITSPAVDVTESQVLVADGRNVDFDFVVVATGHHDPSLPITRTHRLHQYTAGNFSSSPLYSYFKLYIIIFLGF